MHSYILFALSLLVSLFSLVFAQTACNGNTALYSRQYSNVSQIGSHDSAFVGALPQDNQDESVTAQLNAGIRFLQAQSHKNPFGTLSLCHTSCYELDAGSVQLYLSTVKAWLDVNPNEVLTLLLTNGDNVDVSLFDAAFTASEVKPYTFIPSSSPAILAINAWPTIQELITANTRLVVFLDYGASPTTTPYILDEFSYFFETPYDTTDPTFPECNLDRPPGASPDGRMYIVNHFLDIDIFGIDVPDNGADETTNAATGTGSIGAQVGLCEGLYGRAPKGVLVDYFEKGMVFVAQASLNGV
ncbi:hypothetical protein MMC12_005745 [Toensbergia leucococca]|nr:hypothetical protein [Toensbergia leucococca]